MTTIAPLIKLIENPTEYVQATGRVRILSIPGDDVETVDNIGTGVELVDNTDVHNPKIRTLTAGANINIAPSLSGDEIEISSFANVTTAYASSFRLEIDTSSNPDPITSGLLIPQAGGLGEQFNIPWVSTSSLGICSAYNMNEINPTTGLPDFDFSNIAWPDGIVKFNNAGKFRLSFNCFVLGDAFNPTETKIFQILKNGDSIYTAPAASSFSNQIGNNLPSSFPTWQYAWSFCGGGNVQIEAGDEIVVRCILNNTTGSNVLALCNNFSCERLDAPITGLIGPPGPPSSVTLSNLDPAPPADQANILDNPGTGSGPFNFKKLVASAGINITTGVDDVTITVSGMQPTELGGIYGNQNNDSNVIGYNNQAVITGVENCNVIGANKPTLTAQDSNIIATAANLTGAASATYTRSNILLSAGGSQIQNTTNSNIMALALLAGSTDLDSSLYIGDMNNTTPENHSICINTNYYGNNIVMDTESVYIGTGKTAITLGTGECHMDFGCPAWHYHGLLNNPLPDTLYYDPPSGLITYGAVNVPDSTFASAGAGQSLITAASLGTLPVTTTRNFKSLIAGSNITLTAGTDDITIASTDTNIYNTNGSLTSARTVNLNTFSLQFSGTGNYSVINTGTMSLGTANTGAIGIGRVGNSTTIFSPSVLLFSIPSAFTGNVLTYDTAGKSVGYTPIVLDNSVFSVGLQTFSINIVFPSYEFPSDLAISYSTSQPTNHLGYNNSSGALNLTTGEYTASRTDQYEFTIMTSVRNDTEVPNLTFQIINLASGNIVSECKCSSGQINVYNTFVLSDRLLLTSGQTYFVRMIPNNTAGTNYDFERFVWSVNLV